MARDREVGFGESFQKGDDEGKTERDKRYRARLEMGSERSRIHCEWKQREKIVGGQRCCYRSLVQRYLHWKAFQKERQESVPLPAVDQVSTKDSHVRRGTFAISTKVSITKPDKTSFHFRFYTAGARPSISPFARRPKRWKILRNDSRLISLSSHFIHRSVLFEKRPNKLSPKWDPQPTCDPRSPNTGSHYRVIYLHDQVDRTSHPVLSRPSLPSSWVTKTP